RTDGDPRLSHAPQGGEAIVVAAGRDDRTVVFARGVEVVVVSVEAGFLQPPRLILGEHAERAAGLETEIFDPAYHVEHAVELAAVAHLTPRRPHAEAGGARLLGTARRADHIVDVEEALPADLRLVVGRLRAVGAILGTSAGLDAEERAQLNRALGVDRAVD